MEWTEWNGMYGPEWNRLMEGNGMKWTGMEWIHDQKSSVKVIKREIVKSGRPELGASKIVISGGRALKSAENFEKLIYPLGWRFGGLLEPVVAVDADTSATIYK